jgi:Kef-type K+ transport system membrane component KefB
MNAAHMKRAGWILALLITVVAVGHAATSDSPAPSPVLHTETPAASAPAEHAADAHGGAHSDPFATVLLGVGLLIVAAMVGRWMAERTRHPAVLGELLIGILIANVGAFVLEIPVFDLIMNLNRAGPMLTEIWQHDATVHQAAQRVFTPSELEPGGPGYAVLRALSRPDVGTMVLTVLTLWVFSKLGVVLLLFMVGLESTVAEMVRVGPRATAVAVVGMIAPFALGYLASWFLLPGGPDAWAAHLFVAATLCATSVGVTARVFRDLNRLQSPEARIILGAAVIDDVLGLIVLAVVIGAVRTGSIELMDVAKITGLSVLFLGGLMVCGEWIVRANVRLARRIDPANYALLLPLALAFLLAWVADQIQLAMIVGAFAAGLIIREEMFQQDPHDHAGSLHARLAPLEKLFAPVFFLLVGMEVNVKTLADPQVLLVGGALTAAAVVGKIVAGLPAGRGMGLMTIGIGMVPRGEVGLIFAQIGKTMGVVSDGLFSALVLMVMVTTLITPVGLKWSLARQERRPASVA